MSYHCWRPYVCLCIDVDYHGGDDDDGGGDDDDDGKIQNGQLIDWGVRIFGKYQATGFFVTDSTQVLSQSFYLLTFQRLF